MRNVLLLLCLTIATITSGCGTNGRGGNYCDIAKPIYMTDAPIDRSVERSIIAHNETWQHICGKQ